MLGEVLIRSGLDNDVDRALAAVGADSRIGSKYMRYGYGYGGPCLPRDNRAFAHYAEKIGLRYPLGDITDQFNRSHTEFLVEQLIEKNQDNLPFYTASVTYKPNTDIIEESQQYQLVLKLLKLGHEVYVEPSALLSNAVVQYLTYAGARFVKLSDLEIRGTQVWKIQL
jgi:UDP-glucose 6-dehydrogenase